MRYSVDVNSFQGKAETLEEAISIMASQMWFQRPDVKEQVESSGIGRAVYGFTTGQITDHEWVDPSPTDLEEKARCTVRDLYGDDGVLEVDEGATVIGVDGGFRVQVWVWVSDEDAGIDKHALPQKRTEADVEAMTEEEVTASDDEVMAEDDELENLYVSAAEHPVAEFDENATASMGDDPGAYVSGWIHITLHPSTLAESA